MVVGHNAMRAGWRLSTKTTARSTYTQIASFHASVPRERLPFVIATVGLGLAITTRYVIRAQERVQRQREAGTASAQTKPASVVVGLDLGSIQAKACGIDLGLSPRKIVFESERMAAQLRNGELVVGNLVTKNSIPQMRNALKEPSKSLLEPEDSSYHIEPLLEHLFDTLHGKIRSSLEKHHLDDEDDLLPCVCAVPSHFDGEPLERLRQILLHSGYKVLDFVPESVAAVVSLPEETPAVKHIAVFDMGGDESTCSILDCSESLAFPKILSTKTSTALSGNAITNLIVDYLATTFMQKTKIDLRTDSLAMERLILAAEAAKHELSTSPMSQVNLPFITADMQGAKHLEQIVSASTLQRIMEKSLVEGSRLCEAALTSADLSHVDALVLVGGGTKSSLLRDHIHEKLARAPLYTSDTPVDVAVALGAAKRGVSLVDLQ